METMSQEKKRQIRELMREKIRLEDLIQFQTDAFKILEIENELYEVKDTLDKLTNGVWFEDVSEYELELERATIN
jgi:hypothetical protein